MAEKSTVFLKRPAMWGKGDKMYKPLMDLHSFLYIP